MHHLLYEVKRLDFPGKCKCCGDGFVEQVVMWQGLTRLSTCRADLFVWSRPATKSPKCLPKTVVAGRQDAPGEADPPAVQHNRKPESLTRLLIPYTIVFRPPDSTVLWRPLLSLRSLLLLLLHLLPLRRREDKLI